MPKVPLLGNVPKGALFAGGLAAVGVGGYLLWRHNQQSKQAQAGGYGYGSSAYGYGESTPGYYGYNYAYGGYGTSGMGGGITPYPVGSEYGYGIYGYGYYNPYTGQYLGGGIGTGTGQPPHVPTPTGPKQPKPSGTGKPGTHIITADGHKTLWRTAKDNHISEWQLLAWNIHLSYLYGSHKPIPRGTRVKV